MAVPLRGIRAEMRVERDAEGEQRGRSGAVPVGDKTARVVPRRRDRFGQFLWLQRRQITLQHDNIGRLLTHRGFGGGDGVVQRIAVTLGGRVDEHPRAQLPGGVRGGLIGSDHGDGVQCGDAPTRR